MAGLRSLRFGATSKWTYYDTLFAARSLCISCRSSDLWSRQFERQKQPWQNLVLRASRWWHGSLLKSQAAYGQRSFGRGGPLWVNNNYRPEWMKIQVCQTGLEGPREWGSTMPGAKWQSLFCQEEHLHRAVDALVLMDRQTVTQSVSMFRSVLKACCKRKALVQAKRVHAHLARHGLETSKSLGEHVVVTLVKCGGFHDAVRVFHSLSHRTAFSWTALISWYAVAGQGQEALRMYQLMQEEGVEPNNYTFVSLLKACSVIGDLEEGKRIHSEAMKYRYGADLFVRTCLVYMYGKCGHVGDARAVFDAFPERNVVLWNAMLAACVHQGQPQQALQLYEQMKGEGVSPDDWTFVSILQACGMLAEKEETTFLDGRCTKEKSLQYGREVHADTQRKACSSSVFVSNTLVSMYGKCGSIVDAQNVFDRLSKRNVVSWNALLAAYAYQGEAGNVLQLFEKMQEEGITPNDRTRNTLISVYGKCGRIVDAQSMFDGLMYRDLVSWNAMLMAYVEQGEEEKVLQLYEQMKEEGASADAWTFVSVLQACSILAETDQDVVIDGFYTKPSSLWKGKTYHSYARRKGYDSNVWVCNSLIRLYGKCGSITDAKNVFTGLLQRNVVSWNALLAAYVHQAQGDKALQLYVQMREEGVSADAWTFVAGLQSCGMLAEKDIDGVVNGRSFNFLSMGRVMHSEAWRKGYTSDDFLGGTLVSLYGRCGCVADAHIVFDALWQKDVVVWTAMLMVHVEEGKAEKVLQMYQQMTEEGVSPDAWTFVSLLQACTLLVDMEEDVFVYQDSMSIGPLSKGKALHAMAARRGFDSSVFVGNALVTLYGKCGSVLDAQNVFDVLSQRDVVSWNAMLTAYVEHGGPEKALQLYEQMQKENVSPTVRTFVSILQACGKLAETDDEGSDGLCTKVKPLDRGKAIHVDAQKRGCDSDVFLASALIGMYRKCGSIADAQNVFDGLSQRDVVLWNVMLAACGEQGQGEKVLQLYEQMREEGADPDVRTFVSTIQACGMLAEHEEDIVLDGLSMSVKSLQWGKALHAEAQRNGYDLGVFVGNTLVSVYGKCGSIQDAVNVFDGLCERDVVSWNAVLAAYAEQGQGGEALQLYRRMQDEGVSPDICTIVTLLQACCTLAESEEITCDEPFSKGKTLARGKAIHAEARWKVYDGDVFVGSTLVRMYRKCGSIVDAQNVFDMLSPRGDVMLWNAMLTAYSEAGLAEKTLQLYEQMVVDAVSPDAKTFVNILQSCIMLVEMGEDAVDGLSILGRGKAIHAGAEMKGYTCDVYVSSTLIRLYGKCGSTADGRAVFHGLSRIDVVSWNAMFAAYVDKGQSAEAVQLYEQMQEEDVSPDAWTFVSILQACGMLAEKEEHIFMDGRSTKLESIQRGRAIHADARKAGLNSDVFVGNTLVSMYGKCGSVAEARAVFDGLSQQRDVVSWNAMLAAYVEQGHGEMALELYRQMQQEGASWNDITLLCILQACCNTGSLLILRQIHQAIISRKGQDVGPFLASGLISAYGRCGSMLDARRVFDAQPRRDGVSWNALISGYAKEGNCTASLQCYEEMQVAGTTPDRVTFLSLLSACSHAGLVDTGIQLFDSMRTDFHLAPEVEHYVSMVDLLGRAGCFSRVSDMLATMPVQPNLALWLCLMGACQKHCQVALGEQAFQHAVRLQPKHPAPYLLMSNIYADAGLSGRASSVKQLRQKVGAWKKPGQSWIEHEQEVHSFLVEDRSHTQQWQLYELLGKVS